MVESFTSLCAIALVLAVVDGKPTTTSLDIARHFGKRHDNVIRMIQNLLSQLSPEHALNFEEMFIETQIGQGATRQDPAYRITRDGFTLLAMGFTGKKALQFKLAYIDAFNRLEAELSSKPKQLPNALRQIAPPAAPELPAIDVRELLLSGQSEPVPCPPEVSAAIDQQAWAMAGEAYELARQHLRRRVAFSHVLGRERTVLVKGALADIKTVTLSKALAHAYWSEISGLRSTAETAIYIAQRNLEHLNAALAGQPKPKDMLY